jgi:hypothetical protein
MAAARWRAGDSIDDEDVAVERVGEQLGQLGFVAKGATDVKRALLKPMHDSMIIRSAKSTSTIPRAAAGSRDRDGAEQCSSGFGEPHGPRSAGYEK